jgi:UPF0716 family protein affecting phage T7 exclusion
MNRILKRPMFRMGGSSGTGITSGLDQPRKQYQQGSNPYVTSNFMPGTLPGFLTSFGLNLLSTPPTGNIFQTAATAAKDPFQMLQAGQMQRAKTAAERAFITSEREKGQEFKKELQEADIKSREKIAGMKSDDDLLNISIEKYINEDLPPLVAERAGKFETTKADELRTQVTGPRYGGVLTFDVRDRDLVNSSVGKKQLTKLNGKFVYDPFDDNYKYIQIINGEVYFDEFKTIPEITLPEVKTFGEKEDKEEKSLPLFGLDIDDPQA